MQRYHYVCRKFCFVSFVGNNDRRHSFYTAIITMRIIERRKRENPDKHRLFALLTPSCCAKVSSHVHAPMCDPGCLGRPSPFFNGAPRNASATKERTGLNRHRTFLLSPSYWSTCTPSEHHDASDGFSITGLPHGNAIGSSAIVIIWPIGSALR